MRIYLVSGEPSAHLICTRFMRAVRARAPGVQFRGVGGEGMHAEGLGKSLFPAHELGVMGVWEVLSSVPRLVARGVQVVRDVRDFAPDAVVFVDGKGFSRRVAALLKRGRGPDGAKSPVLVQYVGPSVWAWKGGERSARRFARVFDRLILLFPFETPIWRSIGAAFTVVGSPALEEHIVHSKGNNKPRDHLPDTEPQGLQICAMLGSRKAEVAAHGPVFRDALHQLSKSSNKAFETMRVVVPAADSVADHVRDQIAQWPVEPARLHLVSGRAAIRQALQSSDIGVIASGTAALEAGLARLPSVVMYKTSAVTAAVARSRAAVSYASLPNLLAHAPIQPELLFDDCTPERVHDELKRLIDSAQGRAEQQALLEKPMQRLEQSVVDRLPSYQAADSVLSAIYQMRARKSRVDHTTQL